MQTLINQKIQVLKFGGTSVKDLPSMRLCAEKVLLHAAQGPVVVVVSAAAGETNFLAEAISEFRENGVIINQHESDLIVTNGENISAGFFSSVINRTGLKAVPVCGWQVPIITEACVIKEIKTERILKLLDSGIIPVITGFQGVENGMISALARGGSDLTAVCLAKFLGSDECYIYTDVPGMYRFSPELLPLKENEIIQTIGYEDAYNLAANGAKVIYKEAVKIAQEAKIRVVITSSFENTGAFTEICETDEKTYGMTCVQQGENYLLYVLHNDLMKFDKLLRFKVDRRGDGAIWLCCENRIIDTKKFKISKAGFVLKKDWFKGGKRLLKGVKDKVKSKFNTELIWSSVFILLYCSPSMQEFYYMFKDRHAPIKYVSRSSSGSSYIGDSSSRSGSTAITRPARSSSGSRSYRSSGRSSGRISGFRGGSIGRR